LERLCEVLDVSASGYADWKAGGQCQNRLSDMALVALIRAIHAGTKGAYRAMGYRVETLGVVANLLS
jgi:hypothetical protein